MYHSNNLEPFVGDAFRCHAYRRGGEICEEEPQRERRRVEVAVKRLESTTRCVYAHSTVLSYKVLIGRIASLDIMKRNGTAANFVRDAWTAFSTPADILMLQPYMH